MIVRDGDAGLEVLLLERSDVGAFPGHVGLPRRPGRRRRCRATTSSSGPGRRRCARRPRRSAWWSTPPSSCRGPTGRLRRSQPKRFTTWFFVAPVVGRCTVQIDGHEIVDHAWRTPAARPRERAADGPADVRDPAPARRVPARSPRSERIGPPPASSASPPSTPRSTAARVLLWHGDAGYDAGRPDTPTAPAIGPDARRD